MEVPEINCKITCVLEETPESKVLGKVIKKLKLGELNLKPGVNEIILKKNIDFFGYYKFAAIFLKFSKIKMCLSEIEDDQIISFQVFMHHFKNLI